MTSITRAEAVDRLRQELVELTDDDNCACKIAAENRVFCKGFRRFSDEELRDRYAWIVRRRPAITRDELEAIANQWQLAQQEVRELPLACDVQTRIHDTCLGWDDFTNEQLAIFYQQLTGETVDVRS